MNLFAKYIFIFTLALTAPSSWAHASLQLTTEQSLYLGESKNVTLPVPEDLSQNLSWSIDSSKIKQLDGNEWITIEPQFDQQKSLVTLKIKAPYISPSFDSIPVTITGFNETLKTKDIEILLILSVRAELVIRFRPRSEDFVLKKISEQSNSVFEWDIPMNTVTGEYTPITVNNHPRGLWVRFRYEGQPSEELLRTGGYLIHIYRGEGEYIVHQPFDNDTHLLRTNCPFEPISIDEWKNPEMGLTAKGASWANCEFRGFVPNGTAYGFGFREHYLETESHEKMVEIKNAGELNKDLINYYQFLEESGLGLSALCSSW